MAAAGVTYKTLAPGCTVEVRPYVPSPGEERSVQNSRRRGKPSAGLTVQAAVAFPVGTMVVIDLRFPGQSFTYRSRGMVSWVTPSQRSNEQFNIGVLVFGMDKLDSGGDNVSRAPAFVSFSLAPDSPSASLESEPSPAYRRPQPQARRLRDSEPAPAWSELVRVRSAEPPRVSVAPRSTIARGSLVSLCAVDLKIARWMGTEVASPGAQEPPAREPTLHELRAALEAQGKAAPTRPPGAPYGAPSITPRPDQTDQTARPKTAAQRVPPVRPASSRPPRPDAKDVLPVRMAAASISAPDPLASTMLAAPSAARPSGLHGGRTSEIPVVAAEQAFEEPAEFDAELRAIEAFERIHGLYLCLDRETSAAYVLELASELVQCEAAICWLVAEKTPRLEAVMAAGLGRGRIEGAKMELGAGLAGKSVRDGRLIRSKKLEDLKIYRMPPYGPAGLGKTVRNVLVAPVMRDGHTVGAIELLGSPRYEGFIQGEVNVLSYLCVALAAHLDTGLPSPEELLQ